MDINSIVALVLLGATILVPVIDVIIHNGIGTPSGTPHKGNYPQMRNEDFPNDHRFPVDY